LVLGGPRLLEGDAVADGLELSHEPCGVVSRIMAAEEIVGSEVLVLGVPFEQALIS